VPIMGTEVTEGAGRMTAVAQRTYTRQPWTPFTRANRIARYGISVMSPYG